MKINKISQDRAPEKLKQDLERYVELALSAGASRDWKGCGSTWLSIPMIINGDTRIVRQLNTGNRE